MATKRSAIELASGDKRQELSLPPTYVVMVVGSEEETDATILELANEGFLTLRFDPTHRHFAYDERAGDLIPSDESVESFEKHGQIQPGIVKRDGEKYFVDVGRMRLKMCALLNQKARRRRESMSSRTSSGASRLARATPRKTLSPGRLSRTPTA